MVDFIMTAIYASQSNVEPYTGFVGDTPSEELMEDSLSKADDWVNARLVSNRLPTFTDPSDEIPDLLKTAAAYYAISDIVLAVYQGEDLSTQYDIWFQKADNLINAYIEQQVDLLANTELKDKNPCRWSKTPTYYQQKGRRR
jgi:hypothetical protein